MILVTVVMENIEMIQVLVSFVIVLVCIASGKGLGNVVSVIKDLGMM